LRSINRSERRKRVAQSCSTVLFHLSFSAVKKLL
jgi:hypothetical protein